jgi:hypothetical protein
MKIVSSHRSFLFIAFVFSPQWVCHNNKPMKTVFLQREKQESVVVRLQVVSNLMRTLLQGCLDAITADVENASLGKRRLLSE